MSEEQLTLEESFAAAWAGAEQAADTTGDEWIEYATGYVHRYLESHSSLFADDLWEAGLVRPVSLRALGQVLRAASERGWMEKWWVAGMPPGTFACRYSVSSHSAPKFVWRSLLYKDGF